MGINTSKTSDNSQISDNNIKGITTTCVNGIDNDDCKLFLSNIVNENLTNEFISKKKYDSIEKELNELKENTSTTKSDSEAKLQRILQMSNDEQVSELSKINAQLEEDNAKLSSENTKLTNENRELTERLSSVTSVSQGMQAASKEIEKAEQNSKIAEEEARKKLQEAEERVDPFYRLRNYFSKNFSQNISDIECVDNYIFYKVKVNDTIKSYFDSDTHPLGKLWSLKIEIGEYKDNKWSKTTDYAIILDKDWNQINFNGWTIGDSAKSPMYYLSSFAIWWKKTFPNTKVKNIRNMAGELTNTNNWTLKSSGKVLNNTNAYELLSTGFVNEKIYKDIKISNISSQGSNMPNTLCMHHGAFRTDGCNIKTHDLISAKDKFEQICSQKGKDNNDKIGDCKDCTNYVKNSKSVSFWSPNLPLPHIFDPTGGGKNIYFALYQEEPWREMVYCFEADSLPVWMSIGFIGSNKYTGINNIKMNNMQTWLTACNVDSDGTVKEGFMGKNNHFCVILLVISCIVLGCVIIAVFTKKSTFKYKSDFFNNIYN